MNLIKYFLKHYTQNIILIIYSLFPAQFRLRSIQLGRQIRNDQLLVCSIVRPSLDLLGIQRYRYRLLDTKNRDGLEFLMDRILSLALNLDYHPKRRSSRYGSLQEDNFPRRQRRRCPTQCLPYSKIQEANKVPRGSRRSCRRVPGATAR